MKHHISNHLITLVVAFIAATAIIFYSLPSDDQRTYVYEVNRPWNYPLLTAPFDIPIMRDSISAQAMLDSIDSHFEPVFRRDNAKESEAIKSLNSRMASISPYHRQVIIAEIQRLFDKGLVAADIYSDLRKNHTANVRMVKGNIVESVPASDLMSPRLAYSRLDSVVAALPNHPSLSTIRAAEALIPNILPDSAQTERFRQEAYATANAYIGVIQQGERIIDMGDIVTPQLHTILSTYERMAAERGATIGKNKLLTTLGHIAYIMIILGALYIYLFFFRLDYFQNTRIVIFLMSAITVVVLTAMAFSVTFSTGLYVMPFTILPIIVLIFLDSRTAFIAHLIAIFLCVLLAQAPIEFMVLQFVVGLPAIVSIKQLSKRSQLIRTAALVFLTYAIAYIAIDMMLTGSFTRVVPKMFGSFAINAVFISFAYILVFVVEKTFGFTSRVTLVELADINSPLLRELSEECPGTFQHSMAVSNLASAAASKIGANVQLVRAGALYHDIGKITNPAFFTENQRGVNPHDALNPLQSANIVINHVTEGLKRAEKAKLPACIRDFIAQHHGRGKARYFYNTYANAHPEETIDEKPFTYPGPNPQTKETSILMMADAVEAASRSLSDHSPEAISALVNRIIDTQIAEGLHNDSPLSFRDISEIKSTFASRLRTMFHSRISYPEISKPQA